MLGAFYRHYVNGDYKWPTFVELSEVNERMFVDDYLVLHHLYKEGPKSADQSDEVLYRYQRLESLGLVYSENARVEDGTLVFVTDASRYTLSPFGRLFSKLMG